MTVEGTVTIRESPKWPWACAAVLAVAGIAAAVHWVGFLHSPASSRWPTVTANPNGIAVPAAPTIPATAGTLGLVLDDSEREYIWNIEHHGLILSRHGFSRFADALSRGDQEGLRNLLATGFGGPVSSSSREVRLAAEFAQVLRQEYAGEAVSVGPTDPAQFLARLMEYRRRFGSKPPKVKLALMALHPAEREQHHGCWCGTCQLRMWGETEQGGPGEVVLYLAFQTIQPAEDALARGHWLLSCVITQSQVAQAPAYLMHEVTAERGIDPGDFHDNWPTHGTKTTTGGVYLCDYDRDGILDMLITDLNRHALYKGLPGGTFKDVTVDVGLPLALPELPGVAVMAAFVDLDGDGWEDLILGGRVYRNEAGRRFVDYTQRTNLRLPRDAAGIAIADYDRDGRVDLYVTRPGKDKADSWLDGKSGDPKGNQLWRNKGNWQFEDVTSASGTDGGQRSTGAAVWLDANNDGWPDLYVINEFGNGVLLLNQGDGTFRAQLIVDGPGDFGSMGVTCGDIDNDGNIDLYVANMYSKAGSRVIGNLKPGIYPADIMAKMRRFVAGSQLYRNLGTGSGEHPAPSIPRYEPLAKQYQLASIGWAYGAALVDLDNDGWLDLYATCGFISQSRTEPDG
ncbi:MAG TPA: VCBS repeat-containing protein [Gemmataceae bacterium]|nr:VCBS repeat-containing protein [Gemmataceae bacterium]